MKAWLIIMTLCSSIHTIKTRLIHARVSSNLNAKLSVAVVHIQTWYRYYSYTRKHPPPPPPSPPLALTTTTDDPIPPTQLDSTGPQSTPPNLTPTTTTPFVGTTLTTTSYPTNEQQTKVSRLWYAYKMNHFRGTIKEQGAPELFIVRLGHIQTLVHVLRHIDGDFRRNVLMIRRYVWRIIIH